MKIYFLSSKPCALTLNGVFYGTTDTFERFAEICLSDNVYAQFSPQGELPIGFFITEELPSQPPLGCEAYIVKDGIAVYAYDFPPADLTLRPVDQKREGSTLATLFFQGKLQLHVESPKGYFTATLPPSFASCKIEFYGDFLLLKGEERLAVYTLDCKLLFSERILSYSLQENTLTATLPLSDSLQRTADGEWVLEQDTCRLTKFTLRQPSTGQAPQEDLLAYAFFECVLLRGNYAVFLCEELQADADAIRAFLGEFLSVLLTDTPNECGLVRKKGERLFVVDYFRVEIRDGKITDVRG